MLGKEGSDVSVGVFGRGLLEGRVSVRVRGRVRNSVSVFRAFVCSVSLLLAFEAGSTLHELGSFIGGYRIDVHGVWVSSRGSGKWSEVSSVEVTEVVSWWSPGRF